LEVRDEGQPDGDIEIKYTGLRSGEKLYEELLIGDNVALTAHPKIMRAEESVISWRELEGLLKRLERAVEEGNYTEMRLILTEAVEGFNPQCGVKDVVSEKAREIDKLALPSNVIAMKAGME
jgi:FlaA1/EpsC-like NDP-sugar epimerase